ncbi:hypothetical protein EJ110_NYTH19884 [Nymphaea thermarum]|nr:hypothetical protein EJ110_NYTH19884 [Nymphaea thermarum]
MRGLWDHLIGGLACLNKFCIKDCPSFESLPALPSSLTTLKILHCAAAFRESPNLSNLNDLEKLHLGGCKTLAHSSGIESFKSLMQLILTTHDGLSRDLGGKLSQHTFERLGELSISGSNGGSDLLFGLPKTDQVHRLVGIFCLADEPPANRYTLTSASKSG